MTDPGLRTAHVSRCGALQLPNPIIRRHVANACGLSLMMLWAGALQAQEATDAEGPKRLVLADATGGEADQLQELVITATRRNTTVQSTPISISAVGADSLVNSGVSNMQDVASLVPSMRIEGGRDGGGRITMRGIRAPAGEATVGLYYGETPMVGPSDTTQSAGNFTQSANLFDVERIEALRGPQGTLYGSSSMGGAMRVLFNKADTTKTSGIIDGSYSTLEHGSPGYWAKGAYNVPLIQDKFAARVALWQEQRGGFVDDVYGARGTFDPYHRVDTPRKDINEATNHGGRLMLTATPTDSIKWYGMVMRQTSSAVSGSWYKQLGSEDYLTNDGVVGETADDLRLASSDLEWSLGKVDLTWASSYYSWDRTAVSDYTPTLTRSRLRTDLCGRWWNDTGQGAPIAPNAAGVVNCAAGAQLNAFTAYSDSLTPAALMKPNWLKNIINEVRLASSDKGKFTWIVGAYYEKRKDHVDSETGKITEDNGRVGNLDAFPVFWRRDINDDITQKAYFGDFVYKPGVSFMPGLALNYGIRRFDYSKDTWGTGYINGWATGDYQRPTGYASADAQGWLQKYNVSYEFTGPYMVYANVAKGFRPGGANQTPNLDPSLVPYEPDAVWNYELGGKSAWFNNRLTVNASYYRIDWTNMQVSATTANRCCSFITNAGAAQIDGLELEMTSRVFGELEINGGLSYNFKSELTEDQKNAKVADAAQLGLKGNRIPFVAKLNGAVNVQYYRPISVDAMGMIRLNYTYTGKAHTNFRPDYINNDEMGGFSQVNLRVGVDVNDWGAYLYANNIFSSVGVYEANSNRPYVDDRVLTQAPREIGFNFHKKF